MWQLGTSANKKQAAKLIMNISGKPREVSINIPVTDLGADDGVAKLIAELGKLYNKETTQSLFRQSMSSKDIEELTKTILTEVYFRVPAEMQSLEATPGEQLMISIISMQSILYQDLDTIQLKWKVKE